MGIVHSCKSFTEILKSQQKEIASKMNYFPGLVFMWNAIRNQIICKPD